MIQLKRILIIKDNLLSCPYHKGVHFPARSQYEEILRLLKEAQSEFSGLEYQTENNEQCFIVPAYTILRVFFDEIEIEEN